MCVGREGVKEEKRRRRRGRVQSRTNGRILTVNLFLMYDEQVVCVTATVHPRHGR